MSDDQFLAIVLHDLRPVSPVRDAPSHDDLVSLCVSHSPSAVLPQPVRLGEGPQVVRAQLLDQLRVPFGARLVVAPSAQYRPARSMPAQFLGDDVLAACGLSDQFRVADDAIRHAWVPSMTSSVTSGVSCVAEISQSRMFLVAQADVEFLSSLTVPGSRSPRWRTLPSNTGL